MSNKKFRFFAGIALVVVMFVVYLVLVNNEGASQPTQQNSDGVVLK